MFNKYYQDELAFLREMGREFSQAHPEAAPFLGERGADPDVERLLEGFAFLTGRVRQKLDDEIPEFTHALMEMIWPHYLRPIPATTVVQFEALPQAAKETRAIARGTEIDTVPIDGTPCRFQTAYDVALHPAVLDGVELRTETPPNLKVKLRFPEGVQAKKVAIPSLRFFLHGEPTVARALYLCLLHCVKRITIKSTEGGASGRTIQLGPECVKPVGFRPEEALLLTPSTSFDGYRLLLEYFAFAPKFLFVDITGLERLSELGDARGFEILFELKRLPEAMPALGTAGILLNCTPAVNLFKNDADPIRIDPHRTEYRVRPAGNVSEHFEIYSIGKVAGLIKGSAKPRDYRPFFGFGHSISGSGDDASYYRSRIDRSVAGEGTETFLTFVARTGETASPAEIETVTLDLLCTNRQLPQKLRVGDVNAPTPSSPVFARFKNITKVWPAVPPPLGGEIYWRLLSHMSLNFLSLTRPETLRGIIGLYNFRALVDRQAEQAHKLLLDGIKRVTSQSATRLLQGVPVRGIAIEIELEEDNFAGEGDVYLFATMLNEFFSLYVTLNSFSQLTVKGLKYGEVYAWPPRIGARALV